jgi:aldose 1-epimerase
MEPVVIRDAESGSSAKIAPQLGFNCYEFTAIVAGKPVSVLAAADDFISGGQKPSHHGIPLLFPFPNRIAGGKYQWAGKQYCMPLDQVANDGAGNAIHGFCLDRPWRVIDQGENYVIGQFQLSLDAPDRLKFWPADFCIEVRYEVAGSNLKSEIRIINPDEKDLPWGFGTHSYFQLPLSDDSEPQHCLLQAAASEEWLLNNCLPTGEKRPVSPEKDLREGLYYGSTKFDDVQTGLPADAKEHEFLIIDEKAGIQVAQVCDGIFRELVVFTPPWATAVCMEPYTCLTDAINLENRGVDVGWRTLAPGEEFKMSIEIRAGLIIA